MIHIDAVVQFIAFVLCVLSPFLIGSAIAFVLNLPMKFIETKLLGDNRIKSRKMRAARRPISLILTLLLVIGLFSLVISGCCSGAGEHLHSDGREYQRVYSDHEGMDSGNL